MYILLCYNILHCPLSGPDLHFTTDYILYNWVCDEWNLESLMDQLFPIPWLKKAVLTGVSVGLAEQSCAGVEVSERSDAQAVGGMKLRLQEVTANLSNIHQLQEAGSWEQHLDTAGATQRDENSSSNQMQPDSAWLTSIRLCNDWFYF